MLALLFESDIAKAIDMAASSPAEGESDGVVGVLLLPPLGPSTCGGYGGGSGCAGGGGCR